MFQTISKTSYETIRENIKTIEQEVTDVPGAVFVLKAAKILKDNKEEQFYSQVIFDFKAKAEQAPMKEKILSILYKNVSPADIIDESDS